MSGNHIVPISIRVRRAAKTKLLFLPHAIRQMSRPERMITVREVRRTLVAGEIIEDYPVRCAQS